MIHAATSQDSLSYIESVSKSKRVLFATFAADGHFNPLTSLAVCLQKLGYDVRWYTSKIYAPKLAKLNIQHYPLVKAIEVNGETFEEVFPERKAIKGQVKKLSFDIINTFVLRGPEMYADIMDLHEEFPFDLLVADMAFTAVPFVKFLMNKPALVVGIAPLCESSKDLPPAMLGMTPSSSILGKLKQSVLRTVADKILFKEPNRVFNEVRKKYKLPEIPGNLFDYIIRCGDVYLQSGTPGFEYTRSDMSPNIHFVGALLPYSAPRQTKPWFDDRLNRYSKVVLVTQGTIERDVTKLLVPTLEAFKDTDTLVVVTTGGNGTEQLRNQFPQYNIIIEDYIPFAEIMPYAHVYISNGGYGGVLLSIENGLPMVVAGVHEGKNEINARVGYFGLGINLKTEKPTPVLLRDATNRILNDGEYRSRVEMLRSEFKTYDTLDIFKKFVKQLMPAPVEINAN